MLIGKDGYLPLLLTRIPCKNDSLFSSLTISSPPMCQVKEYPGYVRHHSVTQEPLKSLRPLHSARSHVACNKVHFVLFHGYTVACTIDVATSTYSQPVLH